MIKTCITVLWVIFVFYFIKPKTLKNGKLWQIRDKRWWWCWVFQSQSQTINCKTNLPCKRWIWSLWIGLTSAALWRGGFRILNLVLGWSDWADSCCIESGVFRHKFRLPTFSRQQFFNYFDTMPLLRGLEKTYIGEKNTFPIVLIS